MQSHPDLFRPIWSVIFPLIGRLSKYHGNEYIDRSSAFEQIFRERRWKSDESVSGHGSSMLNSGPLRQRLPQVLQSLDAQTFLDAPCGDFNWMKNVDLQNNVKYLGGDIVEDVISSNREKYERHNRNFFRLDIAEDNLPNADVWLCRHVLFHLSNEDVMLVLRNFVRSSISYIVTEDSTFVHSNENIYSGGFRFVNLRKPPFNLPRPMRRIPDSVPPEAPNYLGIWSREDVRRSIGD